MNQSAVAALVAGTIAVVGIGWVGADAPAGGKVAAHRYHEIMLDSRQDKVEVLKEVEGLPAACAADLAALRKLAASTDKAPPKDEATPVKFFTMLNHSRHGLLPNGHNEQGVDADERPPGTSGYQEFHYDAKGRLIHVYWHGPDGKFHLTDKLIYDGADLVCRLSYGPEGLAGGHYGYYRDGRLCLVASIDTKERVGFYDAIVHCAGREDYTARFVNGVSPREADRMVLANLWLSNGTSIDLDRQGRVIRIFAPFHGISRQNGGIQEPMAEAQGNARAGGGLARTCGDGGQIQSRRMHETESPSAEAGGLSRCRGLHLYRSDVSLVNWN